MHLIFFDEAQNDIDYAVKHLSGVDIDEAHLGMIEGKIKNIANESFGATFLERGT